MIPTTSPVILATLSLGKDVLREALIEALSDPAVMECLVSSLRSAGIDGSLPTYMGAKEYAKHARISTRTLDYQRSDMKEGVHYSRTGRRIRYHVAEADKLLANGKPQSVIQSHDDTSFEELARQDARRRRAKSATPGVK